MVSANGNKRDSSRMRVRRYVMDMVYQNFGKSVRLPSNEELAKELGIARSTVQLGIKSLIQEKYLESRPGIGTFTVPTAGGVGTRFPQIALLEGDGKIFYSGYYSYSLRSHIGMALGTLPALIQDVRIYSERENDIFEELRSIRCCGYVCISPPENYHALLRRLSGFRPVVVADDCVPGISSVELDRYKKGRILGKMLLKEGRRNAIFSQGRRYRDTTFRGCQDEFAAAGVSLPDSSFFLLRDTERLKEALENGLRPQAAMLSVETTDEIIELFRKYRIDLEQECRICTFMYAPPTIPEPMLQIRFPFREFGRQTADLMHRLLAEPELPPEHIVFDADYQYQLIQQK